MSFAKASSVSRFCRIYFLSKSTAALYHSLTGRADTVKIVFSFLGANTECYMNTYARRAVTLIEIIIVMILIATITGTLAISYRGTLEKGYAFKTEQGMRKIEAILNIYYAEHPEDMATCTTLDWKKIVMDSPLVRTGDTNVLYDGWGVEYIVKMGPDENHGGVSISVSSNALANFKNKNKK